MTKSMKPDRTRLVLGLPERSHLPPVECGTLRQALRTSHQPNNPPVPSLDVLEGQPEMDRAALTQPVGVRGPARAALPARGRPCHLSALVARRLGWRGHRAGAGPALDAPAAMLIRLAKRPDPETL